MEVQEVEIIIGKDGQVQVHVRGIHGASCLDLTSPLEEALGSEVLLRELTSEASDLNNQIDQNIHLKTK